TPLNTNNQYHIVRHHCCATDLCQPAATESGCHFCLARLCTQPLADLLVERCGHANHGRRVVVEAADGVHVLFDLVAGDRLNDHPCPIIHQDVAHVGCAAARVAHIVQTVEHRYEIEAALGDVFSPGRLKPYT